jgi:hypothetical protein
MKKVVREKKKLSELVTRDSLLTHYYSGIKNPENEQKDKMLKSKVCST